ncbi:MAG: kelch repeat-containing protein [Acidobacteriota bacterium]
MLLFDESTLKSAISVTLMLLLMGSATQSHAELPANTWSLLKADPFGARRGSAIRYAPNRKAFFLWGFMNDDPDLLQEQPLMRIPEYDVVAFDPDVGEWQSQLPFEWRELWSQRLPLSYVPRTYSGITTGSERTVLRSPTLEKEGAPRPDLNIVFDQATFHPPTGSLVYFTGGLTAAYDPERHRWSDLNPRQSPPPVVGGSLAYDPVNDEIVLFGGGHVAEQALDGHAVGFTGTWAYRHRENVWQPVRTSSQPPPRMNTRLVCDTRHQVLVLFGGDSQSHYLNDTWLYDLKRREWRPSRAEGAPAARAGHFTVYDPKTGWVFVGGGYNTKDLEDMWAYDVGSDRWLPVKGKVPTGFYLSADLATDKGLIVLVTNTQKPGDTTTCNILYPVRKTYGYRIVPAEIEQASGTLSKLQTIAKWQEAPIESDAVRRSRAQVQRQRLADLTVNQWVHLAEPGRAAPTRTWGSATFDTDRGWILYWGGGHCGYEGNDVDAYDVQDHTWKRLDAEPEYPERTWNHGVRLAGVTFKGGPWTDHGRRIYAYDPVSRRMIMVRTVRLTTGYEPGWLKAFPSTLTSDYQAKVDALVNPPSSYVKYVTWSFDPDRGSWELLGAAPAGLDTVFSTPKGVMAVNVDWPSRLNDAGYLLPWKPSDPAEDKALYLWRSDRKDWERLTEGPLSPQNLYEQTSLAYDPKRDLVYLHGAGERRDELWLADLQTRRWRKLEPQVAAPPNQPPQCGREAVLIPKEDVLLVYEMTNRHACGWTVWAYHIGANRWQELAPSAPSGSRLPERIGQNAAMVYDPTHDVVLLVVGERGDEGKASVFALRYQSSSHRRGQ